MTAAIARGERHAPLRIAVRPGLDAEEPRARHLREEGARRLRHDQPARGAQRAALVCVRRASRVLARHRARSRHLRRHRDGRRARRSARAATSSSSPSTRRRASARRTRIRTTRSSIWGGGGQPSDANLEKPLIAAINGLAVGVGLTLALQCQLRVMADDAWIGDTHTKIGRLGSAHNLYAALPRTTAAYLTLCNGRLTAQECLQQAIVNKVVPSDQLMAAAEQMAEMICESSPLAVQAAVRLYRLTAAFPAAARRVRAPARPGDRGERGRRRRRARVQGEAQAGVEAALRIAALSGIRSERIGNALPRRALERLASRPDSPRRIPRPRRSRASCHSRRRRHRRVRAPRERASRQGARTAGRHREPGGADGNIGMESVAKAPPDGYTMLFNSSAATVNPGDVPEAALRAGKELKPVAVLCEYYNLVVVNAEKVPAKTLAEFVALLKARIPASTTSPSNGARLGIDYFKLQNGRGRHHRSLSRRRRRDHRTAPRRRRLHDRQRAGAHAAHRVGQAARARLHRRRSRDPDLPDVPTTAEAGCRSSRTAASSAPTFAPPRRRTS